MIQWNGYNNDDDTKKNKKYISVSAMQKSNEMYKLIMIYMKYCRSQKRRTVLLLPATNPLERHVIDFERAILHKPACHKCLR